MSPQSNLSQTKIFESKIRNIDRWKIIGDFIDLTNFYHLKKCENCRFIDRTTQIYF